MRGGGKSLERAGNHGCGGGGIEGVRVEILEGGGVAGGPSNVKRGPEYDWAVCGGGRELKKF